MDAGGCAQQGAGRIRGAEPPLNPRSPWRPGVQVAARLWHLLVVRAGLMTHLVGVKDYLLLARWAE